MVYIENYIPVVRYQGLNTAQAVDFSNGASCALPAATTIGGSSVAALGTITSTSATAFAVGRNGTTNPAFDVDCATSSSATGVKVKSAAATAGVAISTISSGTNENLTIDAKGSGTITLNGTATGAVVLPASVTIASAGVVAGVGTGANGIVISNPKNGAAGTLSGTALNVEISIGGVPYYFAVYPTKS